MYARRCSIRAPGAALACLSLLCVLTLGWPRLARACAVCGCGDPTLTIMGDEKPFEGRARVSADLRLGHVIVGTPGVSEIGMSEGRLELSGAYAPTRSTLLVLALPLLVREASFHDRTTQRWFTVGDIELRVKQFVWTARRGRFLHQVALQGGVKAPSAPVETEDHGVALPAALQPGWGSIAPFAGIFYGFGRGAWSYFASATLYLPYAVRSSAHASDSFRASTSVQRQVGPRLAARLGVDTRLDASAEANGVPDPNSGGFVGYVSPALVVSPASDVLLAAGVHAPVVQALQGHHAEATIASLAVTYDF
jgi:hypothetical protein